MILCNRCPVMHNASVISYSKEVMIVSDGLIVRVMAPLGTTFANGGYPVGGFRF